MAQAGIPFTTGFLAKLEVISASVGGRSTALAVIAMVSAAIAAFFYLRVILLMYSPARVTSASDSSTLGTGAGADAGAGASRASPAGAFESPAATTEGAVVGPSPRARSRWWPRPRPRTKRGPWGPPPRSPSGCAWP